MLACYSDCKDGDWSLFNLTGPETRDGEPDSMFILPFLTIEEAVEQAVEEAVEEAVEAVEDAAEEAAETPNSETPHVVSLEERLAECQARIAVLETRLPQVEQEAQEGEAEDVERALHAFILPERRRACQDGASCSSCPHGSRPC